MPLTLSPIDRQQHKLIMLGGKGGVGKTTCAAACAVHFAESGKRTLVISSDPTPSLSDIFECTIGDTLTDIPGAPGLQGIEISSERVLEMWRNRFGPEIHKVISSLADLDYSFVDYVGTAPGIEEEYMLSYILDLVEQKTFDVIVWDTAPAGHTLRLLRMPELFLGHMEAATKVYLNLYSTLEKVRDSVRLNQGKKSILEVIRSWEELAGRIIDLIQDEHKTSYILVTIPEALGVKQTERIIQDFDQHGLTVSYLIVNHVIEEADCSFHESRQRMQRGYIQQLADSYGDRIPQVFLPEAPLEVKGLERIREVSKILFEDHR
jgi:arsenite-transporting ATPase